MTTAAVNRILLAISLVLVHMVPCGQTSENDPTAQAGYNSMHVVLYPPQLQMRGPLPFEEQNPSMSFTTLGSLAGTIGAIAGTALDSTMALARTRPSNLRMLESTRVLGSDFDYDAAIQSGIANMVSGTDLASLRDESRLAAESGEITFTILTQSGSPRTKRGVVSGGRGAHSFYRDNDGNMYALPADIAAPE